MYKLEIESQTSTYDTLDELVTDIKSRFADPFAHNFSVYKQVDGVWVPNPDNFKIE